MKAQWKRILALQLAKVGVLMSLSCALPFVQMLGILTGAGILTIVLVIAYSSVAVGVNNQLGIWYARNITYMNEAKKITARVAIEEKKGTNFWHASLANWFGLGGISVGPAMKTVAEAEAVVLQNNMYVNVFAKNVSLALGLADKCSPIGKHIPPKCHTITENGVFQPLNCWHYHVDYGNKVQGKTHIFYGHHIIKNPYTTVITIWL